MMKRLVLPFLLLLWALSFCLSRPAFALANGDFNGSGAAEVTDAVSMLRVTVGLLIPDADQLSRSDINGNGKIDVTDVIAVLRIAAKLQPPILPTVFSGLGDVEGSVWVRQSDGELIFAAPDAVPPPDAAPLSGGYVSVPEYSLLTKTDEKGRFLLKGVPYGPRRVKAVGPTGKAATVPVTVASDVTVQTGSPKYSRAEALELAKQLVQSRIPLETALLIGTNNPLPAGVKIQPAEYKTDPPTPTPTIQLASPHWLFYADLESLAKFSHKTLYILSDAETGETSLYERTSEPKINGYPYYRENQIQSGDLVFLPTAEPEKAADAPPPTDSYVPASGGVSQALDHVPGCTDPKTYMALIQGSPDSMQVRDIENARKFPGKKGLPPLGDSAHWEGPGPEPVKEVQAMLKSLYAKIRPCDTLFIYMTAHSTGPVTFLIKGEHRTFGTVGLDIYYPTPPGEDAPTRQDLEPEDLLLSQNKACHMLIVIDACYSGTWMSELQRELKPRKGLKASVFTSADKGKSAGYPGWYPFSRTGSAFTNVLTDAWLGNSTASIPPRPSDPPELANSGSGQAFIEAYGNLILGAGMPAVLGQFPQYWVRSLQAGETCGEDGPVTNPPDDGGGKVTEQAVLLDHPLTAQDRTFEAGSSVPLRLILDWRVGEHAEGCDGLHLHPAFDKPGIRIVEGDKTYGPIPDPNPSGCGYGKIVDAPIEPPK